MSMSLGGLFGDHCGPPYTGSQGHEFEGNPGVPPGGVIDETGYCKHCGVQQSYHGGGGGDGGGDDSGREHWRDLLSS